MTGRRTPAQEKALGDLAKLLREGIPYLTGPGTKPPARSRVLVDRAVLALEHAVELLLWRVTHGARCRENARRWTR